MWQNVYDNKENLETLTKEAISWAVCNGLVVSERLYHGDDNEKKGAGNGYTHAPFTLLPSLVMKKSEYLHLKLISLIYHKLIDSIARDSHFLISCLQDAAKSDPDFLGNLMNIYKKVLKEGIKQPYYFGIFRNDFMKHSENNKWIQIEINTFSSAGSLMSDKTTLLHQYLIQKMGTFFGFDCCDGRYKKYLDNLEYNDNNLGLAKALSIASETLHNTYLDGKYKNIEKRAILMVVNEGEVNISDQKGIEFVLCNKYIITTLRRSLLYIYNNGKLDKETGEFYVDGCFVSVIYFRDGYSPNHYKSDKEWKARLMIEQSICIKCPNIEYQLIGSKLMQIIFCNKNILKKYLNSTEIDLIYQHFGVLRFVSDIVKNDKKLFENIKQNPDKYVLKHTQREGGGNNLYNKDIINFFENEMDESNMDNWIVMERIYPKPVKTVQIRNFKHYEIKGISEFGVYSTYISNGKGNIQCNEIMGTLVRTKPHKVSQGGVFSGYAVFDSVMTLNDGQNEYNESTDCEEVFDKNGNRIRCKL